MSDRIKKSVTVFGVFLLFLSVGSAKVQAHPYGNITLQTFYDELSYYGDWINNPKYGYVWRPNVDSDFRPYYTNGHWVMTEYGNTWVSDYDWGWAAFHYGRWYYDNYDGWIWVPDTNWGPAWVTWRSGGGYYGWAPLGPRVSININIGNVFIPDFYWVFIPQRYIYYPSYYSFWSPRRNVYIIRNTTFINNVYVNRNARFYCGPGVDDIRRATRRDVPIYRIADDSRPGATRVSRDEIRIYRPEVRGENSRTAPRSVVNGSPRPARTDSNYGRSGDVGGNYGQRPVRSDVGRGNNDPVRRPDGNDNSSSQRPTRSDAGNGNNQPVQRPNEARKQPMERPSAPSRMERPSAPQQPSAPNRQESNRPSRPERTAPAPRQIERSQPQRSEPSRSDRPSSNSRPSNRDHH
ncbi:MAG: hypothetical protein IE931_05740 [Sphingobacteriales bacterium]|nr:hypothetical protein [Sphingobacteriales bacterium]